MYRFESDMKDYSLWLTKVDVVLSRYSDMLSDSGNVDSTQRSQIATCLKVSECTTQAISAWTSLAGWLQ